MGAKVVLEYDTDLIWLSNVDGVDLGHDHIHVVGMYKMAHTNFIVGVDMETNKIIEGFCNCDDE